MNHRLLLPLTLLTALALAPLRAEVVDAPTYFNLGAATFIREQPETALAIVNEGLALHPDDEPLQKLKALLEQQQDQNQDQNQQDNQDSESDPSDDESSPSDPSDSGENEQPPEEEPGEENAEPEQPDQPSDPKDESPPQQQPVASEMTEQEAEMVLDSLRQLEQAQRENLTQEMIRRQMQQMPPVEKDW
jgi:Ca-activated chloride channel family protein